MLLASMTKPALAAAACGLAAITMMAPAVEPTRTTGEGVVISAALKQEEPESPTATIQLSANEAPQEREPEALAPGVEAREGAATEWRPGDENSIERLTQHHQRLRVAIEALNAPEGAPSMLTSNQAAKLLVAYQRISQRLASLVATEDYIESVLGAIPQEGATGAIAGSSSSAEAGIRVPPQDKSAVASLTDNSRRDTILELLAYIPGIRVQVRDFEMEDGSAHEAHASVVVPMAYIEAVGRQENIASNDLAQVQNRIQAEIEKIVQPLLPKLALGENEYKQVHVAFVRDFSTTEVADRLIKRPREVPLGHPAAGHYRLEATSKLVEVPMPTIPRFTTAPPIEVRVPSPPQPPVLSLVDFLVTDPAGPKLDPATAQQLVEQTGAERLGLSLGQAQQAVRNFQQLRDNRALWPELKGPQRDAKLFRTAAGQAWSDPTLVPTEPPTKERDPQVLIDSLQQGLAEMQARAEVAKAQGDEKAHRDAMEIVRRTEDEIRRKIEERRVEPAETKR